MIYIKKINPKIMIIGDVHNEWKIFNHLIKKEKPDIILQVGDFGYWGDEKENPIINPTTNIYWCKGNHENHEFLKNLTNNEIVPNVFYMKIGTILNINGFNILFIGGSESIDEKQRVPGWDWFPNESITQYEVEEILDINTKIDMVISHTCPSVFEMRKINIEPSRLGLDLILKKFQPKYWFFGHWHKSKKGIYKKTNWICLNKIPEEESFIIFKRKEK